MRRHYGAAAAARQLSPAQRHAKESADSRELFVDVLTANATKRDARQYLERFKESKRANMTARPKPSSSIKPGVNLGGLYSPAAAIAQALQFTREDAEVIRPLESQPVLHVAIASLRSPESLNDEILDGIARTLSQLVKLDMRILLAFDCTDLGGIHFQDLQGRKAIIAKQGQRLVGAINQHSLNGARLVLDALDCSDVPDATGSTGVNVGVPGLLLNPLKRSTIAVVPTLAYSTSGHVTSTSMSEVMQALVSHFGHSHVSGTGDTEYEPDSQVSLDRIIVLDEVGGVPSRNRGDGAHIFINLDHEFRDISRELTEGMHPGAVNGRSPTVYRQHLANLTMARQCLATLPAASSALIITPEEAAFSSRSRSSAELEGPGTRPQKNSLIHNLLTNKPLVSSSLPLARLSAGGTSNDTPGSSPPTATLLKKGMPVTIIPSARGYEGWIPPPSGKSTIDLREDPRIDFLRLVHLIENSFRRKLDVEHYLERIRGRTAGVIIAGDYEGGAILTWEKASTSSSQLVPYLDKFAVLQSSQGSAGVADIVFQAMVRTCFPKGVCWRSRNDNPVNKWYFERASGTWTIPDSNWTMFWTGGGVVEDEKRWDEYVGVCRAVEPSWMDGKRPD
ncbi:Amino-acid acetyltransferase, mitochondrial [Oleoguttula sp. CCFEE 5521]